MSAGPFVLFIRALPGAEVFGFQTFSLRQGGKLARVDPSGLADKRYAGKEYHVNFYLARP